MNDGVEAKWKGVRLMDWTLQGVKMLCSDGVRKIQLEKCKLVMREWHL